MKHFLLIGIFVLISKSNYSQLDSKNRYFVSMYNLNESNFELTKNLLEKYTETTSIIFNKTDSVFTLTTFQTLNKKVVIGKMLKNFVPIKYMILEGEPIDPFPIYVNTGYQEEDARTYDEQKTSWIKKYPLEYKKMIKGLNK